MFWEYRWIHWVRAEGLWETRAREAMLFDEVKTCMLEGLSIIFKVLFIRMYKNIIHIF